MWHMYCVPDGLHFNTQKTTWPLKHGVFLWNPKSTTINKHNIGYLQQITTNSTILFKDIRLTMRRFVLKAFG